MNNQNNLYQKEIKTKLGNMTAIASSNCLYLLKFSNQKNLNKQIEKLKRKTNLKIINSNTKIIDNLKKELDKYFKGNLKIFNTPIHLIGTDFENKVYQELQNITYGKTRSYLDIAKAINKPLAFRAVALANSKNLISLIIPCHRVIRANGQLSGYDAGTNRKQWLIDHESLI